MGDSGQHKRSHANRSEGPGSAQPRTFSASHLVVFEPRWEWVVSAMPLAMVALSTIASSALSGVSDSVAYSLAVGMLVLWIVLIVKAFLRFAFRRVDGGTAMRLHRRLRLGSPASLGMQTGRGP